MIFKLSLRRRILIAFFVYSLLFSVVFSYVTFIAVKRSEDYLFNQRLADELNFFITTYRSTGKLPAPSTQSILAFIGPSGLPDNIRTLV
ncbi:MAG TPA: hypothetical protein PLV45_17805, partial [bacterium]|nr:hypothetical protein [bacterium]